MSRSRIYRRQLLRAVDAFLEGTPSARVRAQRSIQRCQVAIGNEAKEATLDQIIWNLFIRALSDSVFYESEAYLREIRELLLGQSSQTIARTILSEDFRPSFTAEEAEWHVQLLSMVDFLRAIPYAKIHEATFEAWQQRDTWATTRTVIPEAIQADEAEAEYQRRKALIEAIAARSPSPEQMGDEKIYHVVLREVTTLITSIKVGPAAVVWSQAGRWCLGRRQCIIWRSPRIIPSRWVAGNGWCIIARMIHQLLANLQSHLHIQQV